MHVQEFITFLWSELEILFFFFNHSLTSVTDCNKLQIPKVSNNSVVIADIQQAKENY